MTTHRDARKLVRYAVLLAGVLIPSPSPGQAEQARLPVTADVGICAHRKEKHVNTGSRPRVRVKGNEHYYLFTFETKRIANWKITEAVLHLKPARGHLRRVGFSTVPCAWIEGTARYGPQKGATCFTHVRYPTRTWPILGRTDPPAGGEAHRGGTMLDATFNSPHMRWEASDVKAAKDGWLAIAIDPGLVQACAAGLSHGLVMSDEKGQTRENHDVFTREQSGARPYLVVRGEPRPAAMTARPPCKVRPFQPGADFQAGAIRVDTFWAERDVVGSRVRVFRQGQEDRRPVRERVTLDEPVVEIGGLPADEPADRPSGWTVEVVSYVGRQACGTRASATASPPLAVPRQQEVREAELHMPASGQTNGWSWRVVGPSQMPGLGRKAGPDGTRPAPVSPRNAWLGFQVVLEPPKGKARGVSVELHDMRKANEPHGAAARLTNVRLFRLWQVDHKGRWPPEVLVPLKSGQAFDIPWARNQAPGRSAQALFIDVWAPADAVPGAYRGALDVSQGGKTLVEIPLAVKVAPPRLPDAVHVVGDMNTYGSPARSMGVRPRQRRRFFEMERKYYGLAHTHRMTLNMLPYSQRGRVHKPGGAPTLHFTDDGRYVGGAWEGWIERFGPLLDGLAFSGDAGYVGPGAGTPIDHIYLPMHENWPAKLAEHFTPWPPPGDYDRFLKWSAELPPIEKCFDEAQRRMWRAALGQFARQLDRRGYSRTRFQVYLNNKYYYRNRRRTTGEGTSLWLLDEPMFADDFLALRHFGRLTAEANRRGRRDELTARIDFRIDISRPTHQRDWLDGLVDLNVCADQLYSRRHWLAYRRRHFGERYWNYRMPASFGPDNLGWTLWPIRSLCWGASGTLVWQTIGSDGDLRKADETALMYPGRKLGVDGPVASLRMKAWRRGLQVAELLRALKRRRRWSDAQLRAWVGQVCDLAGWRDGRDPKPEAPIVTFSGLGEDQLQRLTRAACAALGRATPEK